MENTMPNDNIINLSEMMNVTKELTDLMNEEVSLLQQLNFKGLPKIHDKKMHLTMQLEQFKKKLAENPEALKKYSRDSINRIKKQAAKLEQAVKNDEHQLIRARKVHQVYINAIRANINRNSSLSNGYDKSGEFTDGTTNKHYVPPITISAKI